MQISSRGPNRDRPTPDEIKGLERALDKAYARLRERARADWARHHAGKKEPADARVSVRVTASEKAAAAPRPKSKAEPHRLLPKARKTRRKIPRAKRTSGR